MKAIEPIYYLNGKFVPKSKALISVHDLGWVRGYGVFDYLVTYNRGNPFMLRKHLKRLKNSAKLIDLNFPWSLTKLEELIKKTININKNGNEKSIRIVITGGESSDSTTVTNKPSIAIMINDRIPYPKSYYQLGVKIITIDHTRETPQAKSLNYTHGVKALMIAKKKRALEAVYVNKIEDKVYEGTTSNLFIVKNRKVVTPDGNTLGGITRELVIKMSKKFASSTIREVKARELFEADEVFLSATNKEIMPVVRVDNNIIGNGKPGEITKKIMARYKHFIDKGRW